VASNIVNLTIHCQNEISVYPNLNGFINEAKNHLKPIVLTGNAEEIDDCFFDVVSQPVKKASSLLIAMIFA